MRPRCPRFALTLLLASGFVVACGRDATAPAALPSGADITVAQVVWTQGVQSPSAPLPLVVGAPATAVNVMLTTSRSILTRTTLALTVTDASGAVVHSDTVTTPEFVADGGSLERPSAQFLVPPGVVRPGVRWVVVRDPAGRQRDSLASNDRWPRSGTQALATVTVPSMRVRFVPIRLAAHGNALGDTSTTNRDLYLRKLRAFFPLGSVTATTAPPMTVTQSFGTGSAFAGSDTFDIVLRQLDAARLADPAWSDAYWIALLPKPTTFTTSRTAGVAFRPASNGSGPFTRTSVQLDRTWGDWVDETLAHEVGHNFARAHAPCGNPDQLDTAYPHAGGRIGQVGHDVLAWAEGRATRAVSRLPNVVNDVMGWCSDVWASPYTAAAILNFRGGTVALRADGDAGPHVLVQGVARGGTLRIERTDTLPAAPEFSPPAAGWFVEGLDAHGRVAWRSPVTIGDVPDAPSSTPFAAIVPLTRWAAAAHVRVVSPAGTSR
jgi:hypothetical protein